MKSYEKFLQFNGRDIYFVAVNGQYYIAYKPICKALNIEANRCYKNLKKHNGILQSRMMTCIPENYKLISNHQTN